MKKETLSLLFFYGGTDLITFMYLSFMSLSSLCLSSCSYIHLFFTDLTALCHFILALGSYLRLAQLFL